MWLCWWVGWRREVRSFVPYRELSNTANTRAAAWLLRVTPVCDLISIPFSQLKGLARVRPAHLQGKSGIRVYRMSLGLESDRTLVCSSPVRAILKPRTLSAALDSRRLVGPTPSLSAAVVTTGSGNRNLRLIKKKHQKRKKRCEGKKNKKIQQAR